MAFVIFNFLVSCLLQLSQICVRGGSYATATAVHALESRQCGRKTSLGAANKEKLRRVRNTRCFLIGTRVIEI